MNGVILQFFHWYYPANGTLWAELAERAPALSEAGFTAVWIPPAYKGKSGGANVGYGAYDLFDLGEFDQQGSIRTKYGTKDGLLTAISSCRANGLSVYADVVLNHKDGGDDTEVVMAQEVDWNDRNRVVSDWYPIRIWTSFTFPGRGDTYSSFKWHWWHVDAVSYDQNRPELGSSKLYRLKGKTFETEVSHEHGNFDYLMACDVDTRDAWGELLYWGSWFLSTTGVDGFRLDAVKHIRSSFYREWLTELRAQTGDELFSVGEYWSGDLDELSGYLEDTNGVMSLFDVPLHYRLREASASWDGFDMRTIFDGALVERHPTKAVTFVDNHDTQPGQSLESWVQPWFKPLAYALILLRADGYPCVFYGDYVGDISYSEGDRDVYLESHRELLDVLLAVRQAYCFGAQEDYFDHPNTIGWIRLGDAEHPGAMAVVMTNGSAGTKAMTRSLFPIGIGSSTAPRTHSRPTSWVVTAIELRMVA